MIHRVAGRKLGKTTNERKALFRSLANQLILHERIITTEAKAKAIKPLVEKLVTRAKDNTITSRRLLLKELVSENTVSKMLELIGPKFKNRPGGYTRIVKIGTRVGDRSPMVFLMFVEAPSAVEVKSKQLSRVEDELEIQEKQVEKKEAPKKVVKTVRKKKAQDT